MEQTSAPTETEAPAVVLHVDHDDRVNWAMERNAVPVVRSVKVENAGDTPLEDLEVSVALEPDLARTWSRKVARVEPGTVYGLAPVDLELAAAALVEVVERTSATLVVEVRDAARVLVTHRAPVDVLPFNEWDATTSLPHLIASFVMPNDPAIQETLALVRRRLEDVTGDPALDGYRRRDPGRVRQVLDAVYRTVQGLDVSYAAPPASFEETGQKVRTPEQVTRYRMGTCLDLTVFVAACLEQAGLSPLLVLMDGHAMPACWLVPDGFSQPVETEASEIERLIEGERILVFDSSTVAVRPPVPLADAVAEGRRHLREGKLTSVVDVRAARLDRVLPLPVRAADGVEIEVPTVEIAEPAAPTGFTEPDHRRRSTLRAPPQWRRVETWKDRLLDLTLRNRLLNFRPSRGTAIELAAGDVAAFEDRLAAGDPFRVVALPQRAADDPRQDALEQGRGGADVERESLVALLGDGRVASPHGDAEIEQRLTLLRRKTRSDLLEGGAGTLFVTLGMLHWIDPTQPKRELRAPLILVPVELERGSARQAPTFARTDDEVRVNETLLEKLAADFAIDLSELRAVPADASGADVEYILDRFRKAIAALSGWRVSDEAHLARLAFTKFLMWVDLEQSMEQLLESEIVRALAEGALAGLSDDEFPEARDLDRRAAESFLVLDADSSQHRAVQAAVDGHSFVLQGPPGTGKSQTIANIIAVCLAEGQRVLFVSEKMAALEVVHRRLVAAGLGDVCLELHSRKAQKKRVIQDLADSLERRGAAPPARDTVTARLVDVRRPLNEHVDALHERGALGESVFTALAETIDLAPARDDLDTGAAPDADEEHLERLTEAVERLAAAAADCDPVAEHPFRGIDRAEWAREADALARELGGAMAEAAEVAVRAAEDASGAAGARPARTRSEHAALVELLWAIESTPHPTRALLSNVEWSRGEPEVLRAFELGEELAAVRGGLAAGWRDELLDADLPRHLDAWRRHGEKFAPLRWFLLRGSRNALRPLRRDGRMPDAARVVSDLEAALRARDLVREISALDGVGQGLFGTAWRGAESDWNRLRSMADWAWKFREARDRMIPEERRDAADRRAAEGWEEAGPLRARLAAATERLDEVLGRCTAELGLDTEAAFGADPVVAGIAERGRAWQDRVTELRGWTHFVRCRREAEDFGLGGVTQPVVAGEVTHEELTDAFRRSLLRSWTDRAIASGSLARFHGAEQRRLVSRFRRLDAELIESAAARILGRLASRLPKARDERSPAAGSEVALLEREARKQRGHLPIRRLFTEIPNLVSRLKPCMLMGPLSVAQYLPPGSDPFDLVVFDEASQICTHDAIGAIARGRRLIVVGDSKQLPPTTFFHRGTDEEEDDDLVRDDDLVELESILDECAASRLPELMLSWHYRSRDESLITFSNWHYYENRLKTYPPCRRDAEGFGVSLRRVEGVYDRGGSATNEIEARAVVDEVVARLLDPERRDLTIGVVTFSSPQQILIEDMLDAERRSHPEIEAYFDDEREEPVMVKNLENVQGDERDVMLFSICYGPDADGRIAMNFGPLNRQGGERRLNVAVTRARRELLVFASLEPHRIDLSRTRSVGVAHLRAFLEYAERGPAALAQALERRDDAPPLTAIERDVARGLEERGWGVDLQVGCSEYRVDIAVRDPEDDGRWLLAIECDGASYHAAPTARERDRLRAQVLQANGWTLHRTWCLDWMHDPARELDEIERRLRDLAAGREVVEEPEDDEPLPAESHAPVVEHASVLPAVKLVDHEPVVLESPGEIDIHDEAATPALEAMVQTLVSEEAPVAVEELMRRIAGTFEVKRLGAKVEERLTAIVEASPGVTRRGEFLWLDDQDPSTWNVVRRPAPGVNPRAADHIPTEEAAAAALWALRGAIALGVDDLIREMARLFGHARTGSRVAAKMREGIQLLARRGACTLAADRVELGAV